MNSVRFAATRMAVVHLFFFNDTATTEIYTLSLHDALPIWHVDAARAFANNVKIGMVGINVPRSEEHTSALQSRSDLVCRLLLEQKKHKLPVPRKLEIEKNKHRKNEELFLT